MEAPEEDKEILEEMLKLYKESKNSARRRKKAMAPGSKVQSSLQLDAGSPRPVSFTIDENAPVEKGHMEMARGEETSENVRVGLERE